jgi:hypothetical protein
MVIMQEFNIASNRGTCWKQITLLTVRDEESIQLKAIFVEQKFSPPLSVSNKKESNSA